MRPCESAAAKPGVPFQEGRPHTLHAGFDLGVAQLAHIKLARRTARVAHPAQKNVTCRLHDPLAHHNALPVVRERARACVRLQYRLTGFLKLEEQGIAITRHESSDPANQTYAT